MGVIAGKCAVRMCENVWSCLVRDKKRVEKLLICVWVVRSEETLMRS